MNFSYGSGEAISAWWSVYLEVGQINFEVAIAFEEDCWLAMTVYNFGRLVSGMLTKRSTYRFSFGILLKEDPLFRLRSGSQLKWVVLTISWNFLKIRKIINRISDKHNLFYLLIDLFFASWPRSAGAFSVSVCIARKQRSRLLTLWNNYWFFIDLLPRWL